MRGHMLLTAASTLCIAILIAFLTLPTMKLDKTLAWRKMLYQSPLRKIFDDYQAPLLYCDLENSAPDHHFVHLLHGYSLDQHKQNVGDIVPWNSEENIIFPETKHHGLAYSAMLDDAGMSAVRADIGIDVVHCNLYGEFIYSWEVGPHSALEGEELRQILETNCETCRYQSQDDCEDCNLLGEI